LEQQFFESRPMPRVMRLPKRSLKRSSFLQLQQQKPGAESEEAAKTGTNVKWFVFSSATSAVLGNCKHVRSGLLLLKEKNVGGLTGLP
jgi:hypothetical protein